MGAANITTVAPNLFKEPITVSHASLAKGSEDSDFKAVCPACPKGLLLVYRNQTTFALQRVDRCVGCGQAFIYTDESIGGEPFEPGQ